MALRACELQLKDGTIVSDQFEKLTSIYLAPGQTDLVQFFFSDGSSYAEAVVPADLLRLLTEVDFLVGPWTENDLVADLQTLRMLKKAFRPRVAPRADAQRQPPSSKKRL